jgi:hypothetical protein
MVFLSLYVGRAPSAAKTTPTHEEKRGKRKEKKEKRKERVSLSELLRGGRVARWLFS